MTANYKLDASFEVRKFLWQELTDNNIFDINEYYSDNIGEAINPIIPVQQQPELNQFLSGKKHIVYDKIGTSVEDNWMISCDQLLFTIYAVDILDLTEIRNFMIDLFRRMDDSARDVNALESLSDKFKFHSLYVVDVSPVAPSEELQGLLTADITIEAKYSRILDNNGRYL